ncbi:MAG: BrnT family toxin [Gemmatimonadota bacterium]
MCIRWGVQFEWDARKAVSNLGKHGVDFADAATVLHDDRAVTVRDEMSGEERFVTVGTDALGRVLTVVYTWREERARLISARRATRREQREYEE